jgi:H+/Cl- antiporter ClcA
MGLMEKKGDRTESLLVAIAAGSASALFLTSLDWVTSLREGNRFLILLLPIVGFAVGWLYMKFGENVEAGSNLLIDEIHDPRKVIPLRMAPMVLLGTLASHLGGASVGREGTAVQMGGALADQLTHLFKLHKDNRKTLLMAGISAGFASVFGTPLAGALFGLEVLAIGQIRFEALFTCLIAALAADQVCLWWGIQHTHYAITTIPTISLATVSAVIFAGALFGTLGRAFAWSTHGCGNLMKKWLPYAPLRPFVGGIVIATLILVFTLERAVGLGIPTMVESFQRQLPLWDSLGKFALTVASLGSGFKGGEVTPLFYIGATFGNWLAPWLHLPFPMLAGIGLVAVFAGAANTPIASTFMAMELFGSQIGVYAALACVTSYLFSGHQGIYKTQRQMHKKPRSPLGKVE